MRIRFRLALWYTAVLLAGLIALAALTSFSLKQLLLADFDASLKKWAKGAQTVLSEEAAANSIDAVRNEIQEFASTLPEGCVLRVRDAENADFFRTDSAATIQLPPIPEGLLEGAPTYSTINSHTAEYRLLANRISISGRPYYLQIATSLGTVNALLGRFRVILLWTTPLVLMIASLGGFWISSRALAPVAAVVDAARAISIQNLSGRLPVPHAHDELRSLALTWNEMLDRLEAAVARLSQFTADASHELRSPITLIRTTAEVALGQPRSAGQYRSALDQVMTASLRMSKLVEDLLELARTDGCRAFLPFVEVDLRAVAVEIHGRMQSLAAERNQVLVLRTPEEPVSIPGNSAALRRLLIVLLDNALKFTPVGGDIELAVERIDDTTIVRVADSGIGMSAEVSAQVFERFYRADPSRSPEAGAGLGLAIAQAIARAHSATIKVASEPGAGSVFSVKFPRATF